MEVVSDGYTYEADARHVEDLIHDFGLQAAKSVSSSIGDEQGCDEECLEGEKFKQYQSMCARPNFLTGQCQRPPSEIGTS